MKKQVQTYVSRRSQARKKYRRRSTFGVRKDGEQWVDYLDRHSLEIQDLMKLTRNKRRFYQQGIRLQPLFGLSPKPLCHPPSFDVAPFNSIRSQFKSLIGNG